MWRAAYMIGRSLGLSPDDRTLICANDHNEIIVWDVDIDKLLGHVPVVRPS